LHTFVRIPVAALLAYAATRQLGPGEHLLVALAAAAIALAAHGGKTAVRAAVTPSPEPFSNTGLSLSEDVAAVALTWLATRHPYAAAAITFVLIATIIMLVRVVIRSLRALFRGAERELADRPS
jgi:beta-lactamase class A